MAVRLTAPFSTNWNHVRLDLAQGEAVPSGELANYLLAGGAPVEKIPAEQADDPPEPEPEPEPEDPGVDVDGDGVPDGTIGQIQEWVGDDPDRAALALAAEQAKGDAARSTLVAALSKLTDPND